MDTQRIEAVLALLDQVVGGAGRTVARLADACAQVLAAGELTPEGGVRLTDDHRQALQAPICAALDDSAVCCGAGFASYAPPTPTAAHFWTLEWWYKDGESLRQAHLDDNQETRQRLDFRIFNWFDQPARHRESIIDGPYVDYVCNGEYTFTAAHPVLVGGTFVGVAAADVLVSTLNRLAMPVLSAVGQPVLVLNGEARVVISTLPGVRIGMLWHDAEGCTSFESAGHPLRLVVLPPGLQPAVQRPRMRSSVDGLEPFQH